MRTSPSTRKRYTTIWRRNKNESYKKSHFGSYRVVVASVRLARLWNSIKPEILHYHILCCKRITYLWTNQCPRIKKQMYEAAGYNKHDLSACGRKVFLSDGHRVTCFINPFTTIKMYVSWPKQRALWIVDVCAYIHEEYKCTWKYVVSGLTSS